MEKLLVKMLKLRKYQSDAVLSLYKYFERYNGNPLIEIPTGGGKSLIIADFISGVMKADRSQRFLMLTHRKELIQQNYNELLRQAPELDIGIYSAGLGRRQLNMPITMAGIQSVYKKANQLGHQDLVLVDECHLIPDKGLGMYRSLLTDLKAINPKIKVIGFTATPFRLGQGLLHKGNGAIFTDIAYKISVKHLIEEGYLCRPITKDTESHPDLTGIKKVAGEYSLGQLEDLMSDEGRVREALNEVVKYKDTRYSWMIFCSGVRHCKMVSKDLTSRGVTNAIVTGNTPNDEREKIIKDFKDEKITAIINANVLTTGFNAKNVDMLVMLRPTKSTSLYIQMIGRGTRPVYEPKMPLNTREERLEAIKWSNKPNCLVLDYANLIEEHGAIDEIVIDEKNNTVKKGEAPKKTCEKCKSVVHAALKECPDCAWVFPEKEIAKHKTTASKASILKPEDQWVEVDKVTYKKHIKKGGVDSLKVTYHTKLNDRFYEWVCIDHTGYAKELAMNWLRRRDCPAKTVDDFLQNHTSTCKIPSQILVGKNGKYTKIIANKW
jgi:DNA repair protein RadD